VNGISRSKGIFVFKNMQLYISSKEFRMFAELMDNKDNPDFIVKPKDHFDYDMAIKLIYGLIPDHVCIDAKKTLQRGFHHFFDDTYANKRKIGSRYISNKKIREKVFNIHGEKCLCCGCYSNISLDHIQSIRNGGKNEIENLQPLCRSCNSSKGAKTIDYRNSTH
jgi:hypothetical protein